MLQTRILDQSGIVKNQRQSVDHHLIAEQLRQQARLYVNAQKYRMKYGNLLRSKFQYIEDDELETTIMEKFASTRKIEVDLEKKITQLLKQHKWSEYLLKIKGVGPIIAASIIGELDGARYNSIEKDKKVTKSDLLGYGREFKSTADLWSYAGWSVVDGKAKKPTRGEFSNWNKYLKLACYKFAESIIKTKGEYRDLYDKRKAFEKENHTDLKPIHIEKRVKRYVIKKFLSNIKHELLN